MNLSTLHIKLSLRHPESTKSLVVTHSLHIDEKFVGADLVRFLEDLLKLLKISESTQPQ